MIELIFGPAPCDESPALEVTSYPSPLDPAFTMSRVCVYEGLDRSRSVTELVPACRMKLDDAIEAAFRHAERVGWSRIYVQCPLPGASHDAAPAITGNIGLIVRPTQFA